MVIKGRSPDKIRQTAFSSTRLSPLERLNLCGNAELLRRFRVAAKSVLILHGGGKRFQRRQLRLGNQKERGVVAVGDMGDVRCNKAFQTLLVLRVFRVLHLRFKRHAGFEQLAEQLALTTLVRLANPLLKSDKIASRVPECRVEFFLLLLLRGLRRSAASFAFALSSSSFAPRDFKDSSQFFSAITFTS